MRLKLQFRNEDQDQTADTDTHYRYLGINRKLLMCYIFWIFSAAEGNVILEVVGSKVLLPCNVSVSNLTQLTWKMNEINLLSYRPQGDLHIYNKEELNMFSLNMNISTSKSQLYALIIERVQRTHTGNFTCVTVTSTGVQEQTWKLMITGHEDADNWKKLVIPMASTVSCVFFLIFIFAFIFLQRTCKHAKNNQTTTAVKQEQTEDIYENCLEIERHSH